MERPRILIASLCWVLSWAAVAQAPDPSWTLVRDGENVSVYTRDVSGSSFVESLGRTVVTARLSTLVALIMDARSHSDWIDTIDESRQLDAVSPTEVYNYTLSGAPWPVADRDAVVLTKVGQDPASGVVTIRSVAKPDHIPPREGVVRVPELISSWTLVPRPGGAVEVNYRLHNDPGGELPTWLINSLSSDQPYETLENLRGYLERENPYAEAVLPYIREPGA